MKKCSAFLMILGVGVMSATVIAGEFQRKTSSRQKSAGADLSYTIAKDANAARKIVLRSAMLTTTNSGGSAVSATNIWTVTLTRDSIDHIIGSSGTDAVTGATTVIYFEAPVYQEDGDTIKYSSDSNGFGAEIAESYDEE